MKKLYIPKGTTCRYESLETDHIIVKGCLKVDGAVKCRHISGKGVVEAGLISADTITASDLEAADVVARRLISKRMCACQAHVTEHMAVSCYLEAQVVDAGKLTVARSQIGELHCDDVVNLPVKRRSLFGTLFSSFLRGLWTSLTCGAPKGEVMDAEWKPAEPKPEAETGGDRAEAKQPSEEPKAEAQTTRFTDLETDFEFLRLAGLYRLLKSHGYYVRLAPAEPAQSTEPFPGPEPQQEQSATSVVLPAA